LTYKKNQSIVLKITGDNKMRLQTDETKVVTIEDRTIAVDTLPEQAKQLVAFYDDWKQRELEARSEMMMASTAMKALANQIAQVVVEAEQAAAQAAELDAEAGDLVDKIRETAND